MGLKLSNLLVRIRKEDKYMKCKNCGSNDKWRCPVYQSVDVEVGKDGQITDNGIDFSDPDLEKSKLFCDNCGEDAN